MGKQEVLWIGEHWLALREAHLFDDEDELGDPFRKLQDYHRDLKRPLRLAMKEHIHRR